MEIYINCIEVVSLSVYLCICIYLRILCLCLYGVINGLLILRLSLYVYGGPLNHSYQDQDQL